MEGKRVLRLDYLRENALLVMTLTHLGPGSPLIAITGCSRFLINAAEVFFFNSGCTVGYISVDQPLRSRNEVGSAEHGLFTGTFSFSPFP